VHKAHKDILHSKGRLLRAPGTPTTKSTGTAIVNVYMARLAAQLVAGRPIIQGNYSNKGAIKGRN